MGIVSMGWCSVKKGLFACLYKQIWIDFWDISMFTHYHVPCFMQYLVHVGDTRGGLLGCGIFAMILFNHTHVQHSQYWLSVEHHHRVTGAELHQLTCAAVFEQVLHAKGTRLVLNDLSPRGLW